MLQATCLFKDFPNEIFKKSFLKFGCFKVACILMGPIEDFPCEFSAKHIVQYFRIR